jgi:hypothetical protein
MSVTSTDVSNRRACPTNRRAANIDFYILAPTHLLCDPIPIGLAILHLLWGHYRPPATTRCFIRCDWRVQTSRRSSSA